MSESDSEDFVSADSDSEAEEVSSVDQTEESGASVKASVNRPGGNEATPTSPLLTEPQLPPCEEKVVAPRPSTASEQSTSEQSDTFDYYDTKKQSVISSVISDDYDTPELSGIPEQFSIPEPSDTPEQADALDPPELTDSPEQSDTPEQSVIPDQSNTPKQTPDQPAAKDTKPLEPEKLHTTTTDGDGWGRWGGWRGSLWSSVSSVAGSAQAIGQRVTAVIASVEDTLGVPSPEVLAQGTEEEEEDEKEGGEFDQEVLRQIAEDVKEHDGEPVKEEPHRQGPSEEGSLPEEGEEGPLSKEGPLSEEGPPSENCPVITVQQSSVDAGDEQSGGVSGFLSGFAAVVQSTSQGLVSGGLDALETIGKKTMEVLSEGDPGLANKRAMLGVGPSATLSQLLKEAKVEGAAAREVGEGGELNSTNSPPNYSRFFDEYHGVGHLEALELLSKECAVKTHTVCAGLSEGDLRSLQENLAKLSEHFIIEEDQDILEDDSSQLKELKELFSSVTLPLKVDKLEKVSAGWRQKVTVTVGRVGGSGEEGKGSREGSREGGEGEDEGGSGEGESEGGEGKDEGGSGEGESEGGEGKDEGGSGEGESEGGEGEDEGGSGEGGEGKDEGGSGEEERQAELTCKHEALYENGLRSLAEMTSAAIELFRKMAEVSLLPDVPQSDPLSQAEKFNRLTLMVSNELDALASIYAEAITQLDMEGTNGSVTSLYLESSNSGSYVQDAFQLLLPVLKLLLVQQMQVAEPAPDVLSRN